MLVETILLIGFVLLSIGLGVWVHSLKHAIEVLDNPVLALPKKERRAWARRELAQMEFTQNNEAIFGRVYEGEK